MAKRSKSKPAKAAFTKKATARRTATSASKPSKASKPTKGTKPSKPTKGTKPSKPTKGIKPSKPTKGIKPSKPTKGIKGAKGAKPAKAKQANARSVKFTNVTSWSKLSHAYGKATDIPEKLAALVSLSQEERAQAIFMIGASICHQGTFYSATAPTIHELLAVVAKPSTPDRGRILQLLADILTLDDHGAFVLGGLDSKRLPALPATYKRALTAARSGFDVYVDLLRADDADVRSHAAFVLVWIDERAADALPKVRAALESERDPTVRASLALALGYIAHSAGATDAVRDLEGHTGASELLVQVAAILGKAHMTRGALATAEVAVLAQAARSDELTKTALPWLGGNLAFFALRVLAAVPPTPELDGALLAIVEAGVGAPAFAANVLARRILGPEVARVATKPGRRDRTVPMRNDREEDRELASLSLSLEALTPLQRRFLDALARNPAAFDGDLTAALAARGYPRTPSQVKRFVGAEVPPASILDRPLDPPLPATIEAALVAGARASDADRLSLARALVDAIGGESALEAALTAVVDLSFENLNYFLADLAWAAGPTAPVTAAAAQQRLDVEGEPTRIVGDTHYSYPFVFVIVGIAQAARVIASGDEAPAHLDAYLQRSYGFWSRTRDALAALPLERREAWVLDAERDDEVQPREYFKGAWPYWTAVPTPTIVARALAHVAQWTANDGECARFAAPLLVELRDAVGAAGGDTGQLDAALARVATLK